MRTQRKNSLITAIRTNAADLYTLEELQEKDIPELQKLATLSAPKQDYSGRALPSGQTLGVNSSAEMRDNQHTVPPAPKAFGAPQQQSGQSGRGSDGNAEASVN
jgi:ABC-type taurine transport system substrate-binding protein